MFSFSTEVYRGIVTAAFQVASSCSQLRCRCCYLVKLAPSSLVSLTKHSPAVVGGSFWFEIAATGTRVK